MKIVLYDDYKVGLLKDGNVVDVSAVVPRGGTPQLTIEGLITNFQSLKGGSSAPCSSRWYSSRARRRRRCVISRNAISPIKLAVRMATSHAVSIGRCYSRFRARGKIVVWPGRRRARYIGAAPRPAHEDSSDRRSSDAVPRSRANRDGDAAGEQYACGAGARPHRANGNDGQ